MRGDASSFPMSLRPGIEHYLCSMKQVKPLKRSEQLTPLSREHHDALLFIWKIKKGLKNHTPINIIIDYIRWFWENNLQNHFELEEKLLLPPLPTNDEFAMRLEQEHRTLRHFIDEMDENSIGVFADTLDAHIRFEERQLFPHLEKQLSVDQLNEIFHQLDHSRECQTSWKNEFWKKG